jgi:hypothetical protein
LIDAFEREPVSAETTDSRAAGWARPAGKVLASPNQMMLSAVCVDWRDFTPPGISMAATEEAGEGTFATGKWLPVVPAMLTAAGVAVFGILNLGYSLFYGRLGIRPDAVGLGYTNVLADRRCS